MISKELLSEVYNFDIKEIVKLGVDDVTYEVRFNGLKNGLKYNIINIYELANKCKEWALNNDCQLLSCIKGRNSLCDIYSDTYNCNFTHYEDTEYKAIFKACEWILKQKSGSSE